MSSTTEHTADVERATAVWTAALGDVARHAGPRFAVLTNPARRWSNVSLQLSDEPKRGRNRLYLDL